MTDIEIDPRLEKIVWRSLGVKSVRQIADETGLSPEQIFAVKREMLDAVDVLSVQEKKTKLVMTLEEIAQQTQEDYKNAPFEFKSGLANSAIASMKTVMVELNRTSKQEEAAVTQLNNLRRKEIVDYYVRVVDSGISEISEKYGISEDELFEVFNRKLEEQARRQDSMNSMLD